MFGLKLSDAKRPLVSETRKKSANDIVLEGIQHQIGLLNNPNYTVERTRYVRGADDGYSRQQVSRPPKSWYWTDSSGVMNVQVRYGSSQIVSLDGKPTIVAGKDTGSLVRVLETVAKAIREGKLDNEIAAAKAKSRRKKSA